MPRLEGKVALVTGGGGSIGGATARAFAAEGAKVVVADIDADGVERVVSELGADVAAGAVGDVTDSAAVAGAVQLAVERFGGLHVAFANAGVFGSHASVAEYPEDVFDQVMAVNVKGSFLVCKHAMAAMGDGPVDRHQLERRGPDVRARDPRLRHGQARARRPHADGGAGGRAEGHPRQQHPSRARRQPLPAHDRGRRDRGDRGRGDGRSSTG